MRNPREKSRAIENLAIGVRFRVFSFVPMRRGRVRLAETLSLAGTIWSPRACGMSSNPEFEIGHAENVCHRYSIDFRLSLQALPEMYAQVVPWLRPLFGSALTLATVLAVMLNLLLGIGGARRDTASKMSTEG